MTSFSMIFFLLAENDLNSAPTAIQSFLFLRTSPVNLESGQNAEHASWIASKITIMPLKN